MISFAKRHKGFMLFILLMWFLGNLYLCITDVWSVTNPECTMSYIEKRDYVIVWTSIQTAVMFILTWFVMTIQEKYLTKGDSKKNAEILQGM